MTGFETHAVRGRFNAGFFTALGGYINWLNREKKRKVFSQLPREVVAGFSAARASGSAEAAEAWPGAR